MRAKSFEGCAFTVIASSLYISGNYQSVINGSNLGTFLLSIKLQFQGDSKTFE